MKIAVCAWLACLALLGSIASRAGAVEMRVRHTLDERNLELTRAAAPRAVEDFLKAEELIEAGKLSEAEAWLAQATAAAPRSPILARRYCEVLTELGERERAVAACRDMMPNAGWPTAMDHRAYAAALMSGTQDPSPDEIAVAVQSARAARRLVGQPFSDAAFCEIAHRLGDDLMFKRCIENLVREAPEHYETKRWTRVARSSATWPIWLGWGALALAGLGTLLHALGSKWGARKVGATGAVALLLGATAPGSAQAQAEELPERVPAGEALPPGAKEEDYKWQLSQFRINHADPESVIPSIEARNAHPLEFGYFLQDLASEGAYAERRNDDRAALKYWRAIAKAVPDSASGFSKACQAYYRLKEYEPAREYCSRALSLPGVTVADYATYGELMTSKPGKPTQLDIDDVSAVIQHLRATPEGAMLGERLECQLGVQLEDAGRLEACTKALAKVAPNEAETLVFQWSYAMLRKDFGEAKRLVGAMKKAAAAPVAIARMEASTKQAGALWRRFGYDWRYQLGLGIVVLSAGTFAFRRYRAARRAGVVTGPPATGGDQTVPSVT